MRGITITASTRLAKLKLGICCTDYLPHAGQAGSMRSLTPAVKTERRRGNAGCPKETLRARVRSGLFMPSAARPAPRVTPQSTFAERPMRYGTIPYRKRTFP